MNCKKIFPLIAISAIFLAGCTFNPKSAIIKVNGQNITQSQFDKAFKEATRDSLFVQTGVTKQDKNNIFYLMVKNNVVDALIEKTLINQEIEKNHVEVTKTDMDKILASDIAKVGSKEKFDELLKRSGVSDSQFKNDLKEKAKVKKLVDSLSNIKVSDADAKKFYNTNLKKYKYPDEIRASHILISANPKKIEKDIKSNFFNKKLSQSEIQTKVDKELSLRREKTEKILAEIKKNPNDFAKFAQKNSDDKISAKKGGDLGFFTRQGFIEPFTKTAFSQKLNVVGDIVQTTFGYHIILVTETKKAGQESFDKVKDEIKSELEDQAQTAALHKITESLKKQAKIEYINPDYSPSPIQKILNKSVNK